MVITCVKFVFLWVSLECHHSCEVCRFWKKSTALVKASAFVEEPVEEAYARQSSWMGSRCRGITRAGRTVLARSMESTNLELTCQASWVEGELNKGIIASVSAFTPKENCADPFPSNPHVEVSQFNSSSYVPSTFWAVAPVLGLGTSEFVHKWVCASVSSSPSSFLEVILARFHNLMLWRFLFLALLLQTE